VPAQSPTYTLVPTTAGVAVTTSPALKNHRSFSFDALAGLMAVGHG